VARDSNHIDEYMVEDDKYLWEKDQSKELS